jgi:hypothetical protein
MVPDWHVGDAAHVSGTAQAHLGGYKTQIRCRRFGHELNRLSRLPQLFHHEEIAVFCGFTPTEPAEFWTKTEVSEGFARIFHIYHLEQQSPISWHWFQRKRGDKIEC